MGMRRKDDYGLVLAGGGGKGAYEIGVWKAIRECKEISVGAVSGTSVGALNAALFACQEFEMAEAIWANIRDDKILTPKTWNALDYLAVIDMLQPALTPAKMACAGGRWVTQKIVYAGLMRRYFKEQQGMFSRSGLQEIIRRSKAPQKIRSVKIPCYATCYNLKEFRTQYFQLNHLEPGEVETVLLASSAIPFIFPAEELKGVSYWDGGLPAVGDNVPVKPLYDGGWRKFIVVHLSRDVEERTKKYEDCQYIHIFPSNHQGDLFTGTLDFSPESAKKRMKQGYEDAVRQLRVMEKISRSFDQIDHITGRAAADSRAFYDVMKQQLPSLDRKEDAGGKSLEDAQVQMERVQKDFRNVKSSMSKKILDVTSGLAASRAFADELESRGFLAKLGNLFTGNQKRLEIDKYQNHSIEVLTKNVYDLVNNDRLTLDLMAAFRNECKVYLYQMAKAMKAQGEEIRKLEGQAGRFDGKLAAMEQRYRDMGEEIQRFSLALESHGDHMARMEQSFGQRLEQAENRMELLSWAETARVREFDGQEYRRLDMCQKIVCVTSDFFRITGGTWDDGALLCLKSVLEKLEIDPGELILVKEVMSLLAGSREYREYLFERNKTRCCMLQQDHGQMTLDEIFMEGIYMSGRMIEDGLRTENGPEAYLMLRGLDGEFRMTAFETACELLVGMRRGMDFKRSVCCDKKRGPGCYLEMRPGI